MIQEPRDIYSRDESEKMNNCKNNCKNKEAG